MSFAASRPGRTLAIVGASAGICYCLALAVVVTARAGGLGTDWASAIAFVLLAAFPSFLGLLGLRVPGALLAAGFLSIPAALISLAGATLPLVVPGIFFFIAFGQATVGRRGPRVAVVVFVTLASLVAAPFALYIHDDPACVTQGMTQAGVTERMEFLPPPGSDASAHNFYGGRVEGLPFETRCVSDRIVGWEWTLGAILLLGGLTTPVVAFREAGAR